MLPWSKLTGHWWAAKQKGGSVENCMAVLNTWSVEYMARIVLESPQGDEKSIKDQKGKEVAPLCIVKGDRKESPKVRLEFVNSVLSWKTLPRLLTARSKEVLKYVCVFFPFEIHIPFFLLRVETLFECTNQIPANVFLRPTEPTSGRPWLMFEPHVIWRGSVFLSFVLFFFKPTTPVKRVCLDGRKACGDNLFNLHPTSLFSSQNHLLKLLFNLLRRKLAFSCWWKSSLGGQFRD